MRHAARDMRHMRHATYAARGMRCAACMGGRLLVEGVTVTPSRPLPPKLTDGIDPGYSYPWDIDKSLVPPRESPAWLARVEPPAPDPASHQRHTC